MGFPLSTVDLAPSSGQAPGRRAGLLPSTVDLAPSSGHPVPAPSSGRKTVGSPSPSFDLAPNPNRSTAPTQLLLQVIYLPIFAGADHLAPRARAAPGTAAPYPVSRVVVHQYFRL